MIGLFPNCPKGREQAIAEHACRKYSGRVGSSAAAKNLDEEVVKLAVLAHIRHREANYDELLGTVMTEATQERWSELELTRSARAIATANQVTLYTRSRIPPNTKRRGGEAETVSHHVPISAAVSGAGGPQL